MGSLGTLRVYARCGLEREGLPLRISRGYGL